MYKNKIKTAKLKKYLLGTYLYHNIPYNHNLKYNKII